MSGVIFESVTKLYGTSVGVSELSLQVNEEEFFVIVGPSGAGKTTTLKLTAGLLPPTSGNVSIGGELANGKSPAERNVAMTFETYALYPHMTVFENIANPLRAPQENLTEQEIRSRVVRIAELLGMGDYLDRLPRELSGGQKQRVSLGRAMVRRPAVFLLDEPLSHVDAKVRQRMRVELNRLQKELKTTTIYVTHDYVEALSLGDRIGVLNHGKLVQVGKPTEVYLRPVNKFVAKHLGQPEINMVDTHVASANGHLRLVADKNAKLEFTLDGKRAEVVRSSGLENVTVGVRPQTIRYKPVDDHRLAGEVYVFEPAVINGKLILNADKLQLTLLTKASDRFEAGQQVAFEIPSESIYLFNPDSGDNLEVNR